ncbi:hypothetical protein NOS3756_59680 (plasmid) [Nostoc sp. NIES-3756]|uniref:hypothetical protein n=1 Tax=Nostoc sp. NIES-3756 TaxID=1751286 RepID=UPI00072203F0|nr:hypothetical protein [Nostoc sp. NIES-3756]BAT56956.1 hypothetical protein NOS3756_59680 [Nostoc sp. NIES-3756]
MSSIASTDKFSVLVILRREYLDITGNFCAAKLIEYFRHWTKWKLKNHRTPWIYQPLKRIYADLMGEHSLHVIRAAIALLENMGVIEKQKNPGNGQDRTWQYKLNFNVLNKLLEPRTGKTEHSRFNSEQYHSSHPETSKPQQHSAVEPPKSEEVENEILECDQETACQTPELELSQITRYVEEPEQDNSTSEINTHEGHFSAAPVESNFHDSDDDYTQSQEKSVQPSQQEVQDVLQQLREIPCTPQFRLNGEIQRTVRRYWGNVPGAIAYLKEAVRTWKGIKSPEAVFVAACKERRKPESAQVMSAVKDWFEWARKERIVIAMSDEVVYTPDGEAVALAEMMRRYPVIEYGRTVA